MMSPMRITMHGLQVRMHGGTCMPLGACQCCYKLAHAPMQAGHPPRLLQAAQRQPRGSQEHVVLQLAAPLVDAPHGVQEAAQKRKQQQRDSAEHRVHDDSAGLCRLCGLAQLTPRLQKCTVCTQKCTQMRRTVQAKNTRRASNPGAAHETRIWLSDTT